MAGGYIEHSADIRIERALQAIMNAVTDATQWDGALNAFARATLSHCGQLIAQNAAGDMLYHHLTEASDEFNETLIAHGLTDPNANPRIRAGRHAALMAPCADQDYVSFEERSNLPIYANLFKPFGFYHNCQVVLLRSENLLVRASVSRSHKRDIFEEDTLRAFSVLSPYLQLAAKTYELIGNERARSAVSILETTHTPAFLLTSGGGVLHATEPALSYLETGESLRILHGRLQLTDTGLHERFMSHLPLIAGATLPSLRIAVSEGILELLPMPRHTHGHMESTVLAVLRVPKTHSEQLERLRRQFVLTAKEAEIVLALSQGLTAKEISQTRQVSLATVRTQIQSVFGKLNIHRQAELMSLMRKF